MNDDEIRHVKRIMGYSRDGEYFIRFGTERKVINPFQDDSGQNTRLSKCSKDCYELYKLFIKEHRPALLPKIRKLAN